MTQSGGNEKNIKDFKKSHLTDKPDDAYASFYSQNI
jgi:hypothetical protein